MKASKCHKFWEQGRNPITMKKCSSDKQLHIHNRSREYHIANDAKRTADKLEFNYTEQNSIIINE
mgnify:CR=1 FL=1